MDAETCERIFEKYAALLASETLPIDDAGYKKNDIRLEEVTCVIRHLSQFISRISKELSRGYIISRLSDLIVGFGLVHKVDSDERDFGPEDFLCIAENAVKCFQCLKLLLKEVQDLSQGQTHNFLISSLLLCATHFENHYWTTDASNRMCKEFIQDVLQNTKQKSISSLLTDDSFYPTIFKGSLKKIRPILLKDTWMLYPSSCYIFSWLLHHVKHPFLVDYLSDVLPPAFMFVSYYKPPQQAIGIQCFNHVLDNVPQSLIKLDGTEDAIYHSLFSFTYSKEPCIVEQLFPCLLKLPMMEPSKTQSVLWMEFDNIFNNLLFNMAVENNLELKRLFLSQVLNFCVHSPPFKHLKRLIAVIKQSITDEISADVVCRITALKILKTVIQCCGPRMKNYCFEVLVLILELQENKANLSNSSTSTIEELDHLCKECILLLRFACTEKFELLTANFTGDCPNLPQAKFLRNVLVADS
ncbi:hypothetical protein JTE90_019223 [Oedothorax gibbosus]|uniref:TELO2-interacting protein 2 n=1 Tax=Oedothorax gibbosus TaxID=931172 RepID=A0AAV6UDU1_9ARAC|nr:hypothetical protein JTE90_019223 [Oedothorax gibbosus]